MSKRPRLRKAFGLTFAAARRHNISRFGAALAFYIVFAIAPTLLIAIAVAGSLFGRAQAEREIVDRLAGSFGAATGNAIGAMLRDAAPLRAGWVAGTVGLLSLSFALSGVYSQINDALRTIWRDPSSANETGTARSIEKRFASMLLVFAAVLVVLLSVVADAAIAVTGRYAAARLVGGEWLWHATQLVVSTLVLTVLFAAVFRFLPRTRATWRDVRLGAFVTAVLFVLGKLALGLYLGKATPASAFGAAGSIVVVLLWSYWSAHIFFLGLEFTYVYAQEREGA